jgi:hypothetical protein
MHTPAHPHTLASPPGRTPTCFSLCCSSLRAAFSATRRARRSRTRAVREFSASRTPLAIAANSSDVLKCPGLRPISLSARARMRGHTPALRTRTLASPPGRTPTHSYRARGGSTDTCALLLFLHTQTRWSPRSLPPSARARTLALPHAHTPTCFSLCCSSLRASFSATRRARRVCTGRATEIAGGLRYPAGFFMLPCGISPRSLALATGVSSLPANARALKLETGGKLYSFFPNLNSTNNTKRFKYFYIYINFQSKRPKSFYYDRVTFASANPQTISPCSLEFDFATSQCFGTDYLEIFQ